jgi:ribonucleoside-diphosphate reductase alpha chain
LIECADNLDSINATSNAIVKYVSQRAGIGINAGAIRGLGSPIRGGEATHTGCIPFFKHFQTAVKSCSQGGVRGGAATLFYPFWHSEVESFLVLKNNRGTEDNRVRHLDYAIQLSKLAYERMIQDKDISLFSPNQVPDLYDAFFAPEDVFRKVYEAYEADVLVPRKTIKAKDLWSLIGNERSSTGRIYIQNVDHCNVNSPFDWNVSPCKQSNLCLEVVLPTAPLDNINDDKGEIALCTLAAFNLAYPETIEKDAKIIVRALDNLLDYQDYPVIAAEKNKLRRTLGVGVVNYAYWLAKNGLKYSDGSANNSTHELFETIQYSLLKASAELAEEKGKCEWFDKTTYAAGVLPIDRYSKSVDDLVSCGYLKDWEGLRQQIKQYGLRNSTLTALMPSETSSKISNATNGIEPVRSLVTTKGSKDSYYKQVVPEIDSLGKAYEPVWSTKINKGYLSLVAIMQKFVDQTISANTNYDPRNYPDGKVPLREVLGDIFYAYKMGVKTLYYHNTRDGAGEDVEPEDLSCESGACKI